MLANNLDSKNAETKERAEVALWVTPTTKVYFDDLKATVKKEKGKTTWTTDDQINYLIQQEEKRRKGSAEP